MEYNEKLLSEAIMVARAAHGDQRYDNIFPYKKHLMDVIRILSDNGCDFKLQICGALHDTIEDCNISYNDIKDYFGEDVAEIVYCVTDELGRNRTERKAKTLPKIASNSDAVIVKLADRIANIKHGGKVDMYVKEYSQFRDALKQPDKMAEPLWDELDSIMGYNIAVNV
jgi:guanosine-3',5'-bis(diphosphate) 3'-pyrophosphohydrolase